MQTLRRYSEYCQTRFAAHLFPKVILLGCTGLLAVGELHQPEQVAHQYTPSHRQVAVTFDDLPTVSKDTSYAVQDAITRKLLASLKRQQIPVIGFVIGSKLYPGGLLDRARVGLLKRWLDAGFELGNHSYSHKSLNRIPLAEYEEDVARDDSVLRADVLGKDHSPRFYRHPFLNTGGDLAVRDGFNAFLHAHGYRVAPVTIDNSDWIFARAYDNAREQGDTAMERRIAGSFVPYMESKFEFFERESITLIGREPAQVLLLHANMLNADTFDSLAAMIRRRGYKFTTLEEVLKDSAYALPDAYTGVGGITWIHRWAITRDMKPEFFHGEPLTPPFVMKEANIESE
jgi:peptidoglycan/xylan/chitin deacetylase (PgdA/CDA1 family)